MQDPNVPRAGSLSLRLEPLRCSILAGFRIHRGRFGRPRPAAAASSWKWRSRRWSDVGPFPRRRFAVDGRRRLSSGVAFALDNFRDALKPPEQALHQPRPRSPPPRWNDGGEPPLLRVSKPQRVEIVAEVGPTNKPAVLPQWARSISRWTALRRGDASPVPLRCPASTYVTGRKYPIQMSAGPGSFVPTVEARASTPRVSTLRSRRGRRGCPS